MDAVSPEMRKRANLYFLVKVIANIVLTIVGAVLIGMFLTSMQRKAAVARYESESAAVLAEAIESLDNNALDAQQLTYIFHDGNQDTAADLKSLLTSGLFDSMSDLTVNERTEIFADVIERSGVPYLFLMDTKGRVVLSPRTDYYGRTLVSMGLMTQDDIDHLAAGTSSEDGIVTPVEEHNDTGSYYFYSEVIDTGSSKYVLVMGTDVSALDLQLASLKDVGRILSRSSVGSSGFLFAVDPESKTFVYYENGGDVLTGQTIETVGLSDEALQDGYAGNQLINGKSYYCVSRISGTQVVICAVDSLENIYQSDRYVLFWSISGFVLIMILCLAYAVVVRNDFVRRSTETEKIILFKNAGNPVIYDRSLGSKIFPLMVLGVLIIFCISMYTQTLLEISNAVDESKVALDEITGRYAESIENRETTVEYYNNRFLSKAKLLAYLLEEDPSALNAETDHYHVEYDENNIRHYLTDDEGNLLRAVSESSELLSFCAKNDLASVYIFDENGRVIATTSDDWYFILSFDENSQSGAFRSVLDGKTDEYIQDAMLNEYGVSCQYIGVAFHYYTTRDENGQTVYKSRYEYQQSLSEGYEGNPITAHRSVLQIGLQEELVASLLASTDTSYVFSSDSLSGGFVVLFDNNDEHTVLYSPNETSIGKTASELGVSDKAFSGNYYGFQTINGETYFQYYTFEEGYYVATAIPRDSMYQSRTPIALITALVSFIMIAILSATITLNNRDEEQLYKAMSDGFKERISETPFFNVILPSGRSSTTIKAAARWDNRRVPWRDKAPEQKLVIMIGIVFGILTFYVLLSLAGADTYFTEDSVIPYILSGGWDRGLNIFAMSACALVLIMTMIAVALLRLPVRLMTSILGTRSETIGHLMLSVVKYGGALASIFYCLFLLGLDASSLLASAGILSLVIGLGAQSLIKDIIAGVFIVFEGEFRVGDIVTISSFRGTVMDIGLRTTKIMNAEGNIKIYNNSEISGVLNMTKQDSVAFVTIGIEYGQDLTYEEKVLARELPKIAEHDQRFVSVPQYVGVTSLADSCVTLGVFCKCSEANVKAVTRVLNRALLQIFYDNNINIPFPQVTISDRGDPTVKEAPANVPEVPEGIK